MTFPSRAETGCTITNEPSGSLALPRGFRDILPTEARELHAIERTLMETFARYGYVPLEPPSVEFASSALPVDERRMLRFLDRDGRLLALRPDVTTAVARVVAQRYRDATAALRLAYFAPIFREEPSMRGSEREYDQAGVELIGDPSLRADAEVIALLTDALAACGLRAAEIDVGHVGFFGGFIADLALPAREAVAAAARAGDLVSAVRLARDAGLSAARTAALERGLRHRSGDLATVRRDAPPGSQQALAALDELGPLLEAAGVGAAIRFDLGFVPALPYYSGVVFQVTAPGLGFAIAAGGRYDGLLARFGTDRAATGFGIAVPHLHQAIVAAGWQPQAGAPLLVLGVLGPASSDAAALGAAAALRSLGVAVAIGDLAEHAGQDVHRATVIDGSHVQYEGVSHSIESLAALLTGTVRE